MTNSEQVQALLDRARAGQQTHENLVALFEDYKGLVGHLAGSGPAYRTALLHVPEEFPDLQRIIGRKHDAVLKGRLTDALLALKKKVQELEMHSNEAVDRPKTDPPAEPQTRNKPNLNMDA